MTLWPRKGGTMASFFRLVLWASLLIGVLGLLSVDLTLNAEMTYAGILLILLAYLMFSGGEPAPQPRKSMSKARIEDDGGDDDEHPDSIESEVPIKRTRGVDVVTEQEESSDEEALVEVQAIVEDVVEAQEYVVEIDAQSMLETEIDTVVETRRTTQDEIRSEVEKRRRRQLAKIRGDTLRSRHIRTGNEELRELIKQSGSVLQIIDEPESPKPGHPYGRILIQIDEKRVIKLRIPLDEGLRAAEEEPALDFGGLPPPPLPGEGGLPLPPPPSDMDLPPPPE